MTITRVLRRLWTDRRPLAAVTALLAFATGVSGAVFAIAHVVLRLSLAVPEPDRLITLTLSSSNGATNTVHAYPVWWALRNGDRSTSGFAASTRVALVVAGDSTKPLDAALVSANYFEVLGVAPQMGRVFSSRDSVDGEPVCVIGHGFWQRYFGGQPNIVGTPLVLNGRALTVIGVLPPRFTGVEQGAAPDVYAPVSLAAPLLKMNEWNRPTMKWLRIFGRLRPASTAADAAASLQPIVDEAIGQPGAADRSRVLLTASPQGFASLRFVYERPLVVLMGIVTLLLILTCVNVFVLLMATTIDRAREMAICRALGAKPATLMREVVVAGAIVGSVSGAVAVLVSHAGVRGIASLLDGAPAAAVGAAATQPFILVSFAASVVLAIGLKVAAMTVVARQDLSSALSGRQISAARGHLSRPLIAVQVAASLVLVMCALLFVVTLVRLERVDMGFRPEQVIVATMNTTATGKGTAAVEEYERLLEQVSRLSGVERASLARVSVLSGQMQARDIEVPGYVAGPNDAVNHLVNRVSPGYFATMNIPVRKGRDVSPQDRRTTPRVVVINERMAARYWPGQDPIGKRFTMGREVEVVGVVGDSKYMNLREDAPLIIYPALWQADITEAMLHVRTSADAAVLGVALRQTLGSFETPISIYDLKTMQSQISVLLTTERLLARLSSVLGLLGLLLAIGGLYSVVAYSVARHTKEIGIRMALGADRRRVVVMFLRRNGAALLIGAVAGVTGAIMIGRLMTHLLFGVQASDGSMLLALLALFVAIALGGTAGPVLRATRREVAAALRQD
jgi:predicted permease